MTDTCAISWPNGELPDLPHACVIRPGWHVRHACHCGATARVTDDEHVLIARQAVTVAREGHR